MDSIFLDSSPLFLTIIEMRYQSKVGELKMGNTDMQFFKGSFFQAPNYGEIEFVEDAIIKVNSSGMIEQICDPQDEYYEKMFNEAKNDKHFVELDKGQYFLPGFIDLHVHAPQWPQAGVALDKPLNVWLDEHTFPMESKYQDVDFAKEVYTDLVEQLLARGTTTALYFATVHKESSFALAEICVEKGQRSLVGKVVMDDEETNPDYYRDDSTETALKETEQFIKEVQELGQSVHQGVYPVVTPRFVPSCTDEALLGLGKIAKEYNVHVQSHCSEGDWEHEYVYERFGKTDTEVLRDFGLLGEKSVMAHCNFINEGDGEIFAKTKTAVGHCPISNAYFANSVLPVNRLKEQGVTVGLGTDISAGFTPSLYNNIKQAVISSRMLEDGVDPSLPAEERGVDDSRLTLAEAFYLATTGGGEALKLPIGKIEAGYTFDVQIIDTRARENPLPNFGMFNEPEDILGRILYLSTMANIQSVFVQGRQVK